MGLRIWNPEFGGQKLFNSYIFWFHSSTAQTDLTLQLRDEWEIWNERPTDQNITYTKMNSKHIHLAIEKGNTEHG